jgi:protein SCO1/2
MNFRNLLIPALLLAASLLPAQHAGHHAETAAPKASDGGHAHHQELAGDGFSAGSLYQLEATYTGDNGRPVALGSLRGRPVVLAMFFASCTYACPMIVADMTRIRDGLPADLRDRAALVLVSFDTKRDTPEALQRYRKDRQLDQQWTLIRGDDGAVRELAALLGVKFKQEADGQFAHSNIISILNAEGEVVHQRAGLKGGLEDATVALARVAR